jgi:HK97 family phage major capsid protein
MEPELEALFEEQAKAFETLKSTVNDLDKQVKKGGEDIVTKSQFEKVNAALDKIADDIKSAGTRADDIEKKLNRASLSGDKATELETKSAEAFGKQVGAQVTVDDFRTYKSALYGLNGPLRSTGQKGDLKALSVGSDPDGGYLVTPDTTGRIVERIYETSPVRQVAASMTIGVDAVEGLNDLGENGFAWVAESAPRLENLTAQLGKWSVQVHETVSIVSATLKVLEDARLDLESWLATKSADRIARGENTAFVTGDGQGKPRGIFAYPTAATPDASRPWGTFEHIGTGVNGGFRARSGDVNPVDDLINVVYGLKSAFRANASWMTSRAVLRDVRKLKDGQGNFIWQPAMVAGQPARLLDYPIVEAEDVPAMATGSLSMAFGDFREGYLIVDRIGLSVLRDPYTAYPFVFFKFRKRVGGGATNFDAIKFLRFA